MNIRFFLFSCLMLVTLSLSACGTVNGAGQDIEKAGESIQDSSR